MNLPATINPTPVGALQIPAELHAAATRVQAVLLANDDNQLLLAGSRIYCHIGRTWFLPLSDAIAMEHLNYVVIGSGRWAAPPARSPWPAPGTPAPRSSTAPVPVT